MKAAQVKVLLHSPWIGWAMNQGAHSVLTVSENTGESERSRNNAKLNDATTMVCTWTKEEKQRVVLVTGSHKRKHQVDEQEEELEQEEQEEEEQEQQEQEE